MALAVAPNFESGTSEWGLDEAAQVLDAVSERVRGGEVGDVRKLAGLLAEVEAIRRKVDAVGIDLLGASEAEGLHYGDGHSSAKVMARHVNLLAGAEASGRDKCRRMFVDLVEIADAYRAGTMGSAQVRLLGRVFANVRVRDAMVGRQARFLKDARRLSFPRFEQRVREWERLVDQDGAEPARDRTVENRNAQLTQNHFDLSWDLTGIFTAGDGAAMKETLDAYAKALFDADWAEAKARVGEGVCVAELGRTDAQRRADALRQIFADAVANRAGMVQASSVHNIVWSAEAYQEMVRRYAGAVPQPFDPETFRCETTDGHKLDPTEAFADSVLNKIRRVVIDARGVVIDMGTARLFTGLARYAAQLADSECYWPGCWVRASQCQIDHLHDHADGGRTNPGNGAPACGRHNRWKQKGYTARRLANGVIEVRRPDGTVIE